MYLGYLFIFSLDWLYLFLCCMFGDNMHVGDKKKIKYLTQLIRLSAHTCMFASFRPHTLVVICLSYFKTLSNFSASVR